MKKILQPLSLVAIAIAIASCGGSGKNPEETTTDSTVTGAKTDSAVAEDIVLYSIPSPIETFTILKMYGGAFDKALMNPSDKMSKYESNFSKSVNLGVYTTDLSFSFLYKKNQEFDNYLKNVTDLTHALGIDASYGEGITTRLKANNTNMDSLMAIVSEASANADVYLRENQRTSTTALIAVGAWTEGMHIICTTADKKQDAAITGLVADQKVAVKNLTKMLEQFSSDADVATVLKDIQDIDAVYASLSPVKGDALVSEDKMLKSIGDNSALDLNKDQLKSILEKVEALRNKLTN